MKKLKKRWGITSNFQLIVIIAVFSITGSLALLVAKHVMNFFGLSQMRDTVPWGYWPIRILLIFPIYQVLLICMGTLLGQFRFFWNFEKKMFSRFYRKKV